MVSRPCDHCLKVKRCEMVADAAGRLGYLCAACKRELEYAPLATSSSKALSA